MIITVTYNKETKELTVNGDVHSIELNLNTVQDTDQQLSFEIAASTAEYEMINTDSEPETIEEV